MVQAQPQQESVGGRSQIWGLCLLKSRLLWSVGEAERLKGSAPHPNEVVVVFFHNYTRMINSAIIAACMNNLYREDVFYADKFFTVMSLNGPDGSEERKTFETFSQRFNRLYQGYMLDRTMHIIAKPETRTVNLKTVMNILKSKDAALWEESKWMF